MSLQLKICRDVWGTWSVHGLAPEPVSQLPSLSASIDHARKACDAAPATIELFVDGMYIVVHQERGWSRPLLAPKTDPARPAAARSDLRAPPVRGRFLDWLRRFAPEFHPAPSKEQGTSRAAS
jgi:hypothetical protein